MLQSEVANARLYLDQINYKLNCLKKNHTTKDGSTSKHESTVDYVPVAGFESEPAYVRGNNKTSAIGREESVYIGFSNEERFAQTNEQNMLKKNYSYGKTSQHGKLAQGNSSELSMYTANDFSSPKPQKLEEVAGGGDNLPGVEAIGTAAKECTSKKSVIF